MMDRRTFIASVPIGIVASKQITSGLDSKAVEFAESTKDECEHLGLLILATARIGTCYCPDCGKEMWLDEGFNSLFRAMEKRIRKADGNR